MKNYIEYKYTYVSGEGTRLETENIDVFWAVRPTPFTWSYTEDEGSDSRGHLDTNWVIDGKLEVHGLEDVAGLRGLLDLIEQDLKSNQVE